jgi:hypothetical protein
MGFNVRAACDMPELTLLCEYLGEVRTEAQTLDNPELSINDSIMELLNTENRKTSLNVVP